MKPKDLSIIILMVFIGISQSLYSQETKIIYPSDLFRGLGSMKSPPQTGQTFFSSRKHIMQTV